MKCVPFIKIFVSINKFHIFPFLFLLFILYGLGIEPRVLHMGDKCFCCICCYDKNTLKKKKKQCREGKELFGLHFHVTILPWGRSKQEISIGAWSRNHGGNVACCLVPSLMISSLSLHPGPTCLGIVLPTVGRDLLHQLSAETICHRCDHRPIWSGTSVNWDLLRWF